MYSSTVFLFKVLWGIFHSHVFFFGGYPPAHFAKANSTTPCWPCPGPWNDGCLGFGESHVPQVSDCLIMFDHVWSCSQINGGISMVFFMAAWPRDSQADVHFGDDQPRGRCSWWTMRPVMAAFASFAGGTWRFRGGLMRFNPSNRVKRQDLL